MRLARLVAFILLLCAVSIALVVHTAHSTPPPTNIAFLHLSDCALPCWIGIVPGKTTISEAQALIQHVYSGEGFKVGPVKTDPGYTSEVLVRVQDRFAYHTLDIRLNDTAQVTQSSISVVNEIDLYAYAPQGRTLRDVTLGEMIAMLGRPACLSLVPRNHELDPELLFPQYHTVLGIGHEDYFVEPDMSFDVRISQNLPPCAANSLPWQGFNGSYGDKVFALATP